MKLLAVNMQGTTGAIILAAGSSSRLGRPKQLLLYKGKSLLQHAIDAATEAECTPIVVVLGANADAIERSIENKNITPVINNNWQEGMGSSIKAGLTQIVSTDADVENIILMLCDQPFADASLLRLLTEQKQLTKKEIIACAYAGTIGVPAIFDKQLFNDLLTLKGQEGAKKILLNNKHTVGTITFPSGTFDIDTENDYHNLNLVT